MDDERQHDRRSEESRVVPEMIVGLKFNDFSCFAAQHQHPSQGKETPGKTTQETWSSLMQA